MTEEFKNTTVTVINGDEGYTVEGQGGQLAKHHTHIPIDVVRVNGFELNVSDEAVFEGGWITVKCWEEDGDTIAEIEVGG